MPFEERNTKMQSGSLPKKTDKEIAEKMFRHPNEPEPQQRPNTNFFNSLKGSANSFLQNLKNTSSRVVHSIQQQQNRCRTVESTESNHAEKTSSRKFSITGTNAVLDTIDHMGGNTVEFAETAREAVAFERADGYDDSDDEDIINLEDNDNKSCQRGRKLPPPSRQSDVNFDFFSSIANTAPPKRDFLTDLDDFQTQFEFDDLKIVDNSVKTVKSPSVPSNFSDFDCSFFQSSKKVESKPKHEAETKNVTASEPMTKTANVAFVNAPTSTKSRDDIFGDILGEQGYSFASKRSNSPKTINELRKEDLLKDVDADPEKLKILNWTEGKQNNIRALLCSLHLILWPDNSWKKVEMYQLVSAIDVKKAYRKACLSVHPDKHINTENAKLAKLIFMELNNAWTEFENDSSQQMLFK